MKALHQRLQLSVFFISLCISVLTRCRYLEGSDAYIFVPIGESVNVQSLTIDRATGEMLLNRELYIDHCCNSSSHEV